MKAWLQYSDAQTGYYKDLGYFLTNNKNMVLEPIEVDYWNGEKKITAYRLIITCKALFLYHHFRTQKKWYFRIKYEDDTYKYLGQLPYSLTEDFDLKYHENRTATITIQVIIPQNEINDYFIDLPEIYYSLQTTNIAELNYDTNNKGYYTCYYYMKPQSVYYEGKHRRIYCIYSTLSTMSGVSDSTNFVTYYDLDEQAWSTLEYDIGPNKPGTDGHHLAAMTIDDYGYIIIGYDPLRADGGDHNYGIEIYRSTKPEDISEFEYIGHTKFLNDGSDDDGSYPHFVKRKNNKILLFFRNRSDVDGSVHWIRMNVSKDGGKTWEGSRTVIRTSNDSSWWAYNTHFGRGNNHPFALIILHQNHNANKKIKEIYILKSWDGINWFNEEGTFSKNIINEGYIEPTEMSNFFVDDISDYDPTLDDTNARIYPWAFTMGPNNEIYIAAIKVDTTGTIQKWLLYYMSGGSWQSIDITSYINTSQVIRGMFCLNSGEIYAFVRSDVDARVLQLYYTNDYGATWTYIKDVYNAMSLLASTGAIGYLYTNEHFAEQEFYFIQLQLKYDDTTTANRWIGLLYDDIIN